MNHLDPANYPTYNVGDTVTIRQWDDMESEFGLNEEGGIKIFGIFTKRMKPLCGHTFTVNDVLRFSNSDFDIYVLGGNGFSFTSPMFESSKHCISLPSPAMSFDSLLQGGDPSL